jgi:hypothetical protein
MRWLGRGPYRVWKNRVDGMGFDVWANAANDTVTGESFTGPYGPESQLNLVNGRTGTYTGTLHFAFGRADRT